MTGLNLPCPCGVRTRVTPEEFAYLEAVPDPALEVEGTVDCEYEAGHTGPHVNAAQGNNDGWDLPELIWWLHWTDTDRAIVRVSSAERCNAVGRHPNDAPGEAPWSCEFASGHPGVHKWQLEDFNPIPSY